MTRAYSAIYLLATLPVGRRAAKVGAAVATLCSAAVAKKVHLAVAAPDRDKALRLSKKLSSPAGLEEILSPLVAAGRGVNVEVSWPKITPVRPPDFGMYLSLLAAESATGERSVTHHAAIAVAKESAASADARALLTEIFALLGGRLAHFEEATTWDVRRPFGDTGGVVVSDDMFVRAASLLTGLRVAKKLLPTVVEPERGDLILDAEASARLPASTPAQPLPEGARLVLRADLSDAVLRALSTDDPRAPPARPGAAPPLKQANILGALGGLKFGSAAASAKPTQPAAPVAARAPDPVKYDDASWYDELGEDFGHATVGAVLVWLARRELLSAEGRDILGPDADAAAKGTKLPGDLSRVADGKLVSDMVAPEVDPFLRAYVGGKAVPSYRGDVDHALEGTAEAEQDTLDTARKLGALLDERWKRWRAAPR